MQLPFPHAAGTSAPLPLQPRGAVRADTLTPLLRRAVIGAVAVLHAGVAYGLLQVPEVRDAVAEVAPLFVRLVTPEEVPRQVPPPPPPADPPPRPPKRPVAAPVLAAAPQVEPLPFVASPPPPAPAPALPDSPAAAPEEPAAPAPVVVPTIPPSAVQYLEPPPLAYPRASRRAGEAGRVVLRVFIDAAGLPREVQVHSSSGFARLDNAATTAVLKARFKPYSNRGQAIAGWALVPLTFDLET